MSLKQTFNKIKRVGIALLIFTDSIMVLTLGSYILLHISFVSFNSINRLCHLKVVQYFENINEF